MRTEDYQDVFQYIVNYQQIADAVAKKKSILLRRIEQNIQSVIETMTPEETLSFNLFKDNRLCETVSPSLSNKYAKVMWNFLRGNKYKNYIIDSYITPKVLDCIEKVIIDFYSSKDIIDEIVEIISQNIIENKIIKIAIKEGTKDCQDAIKAEIAKQAADAYLGEIKDNIINEITEKVVAFLHTNMMQQLMNIVGTYIATSAGKVLITKMAIVISKSISVTALKATIMSIVKKIGIGTITKTIIGKAIITILAFLGISGKVAFCLVLIPLIAWILHYEYKNFPTKLAKKIPSKLIDDFSCNFNELNSTIVKGMLRDMSKSFC